MKIAGYLITHNGISGHLEEAIRCMDELCGFICVNVSEGSDDGTLEWCRQSDRIDVVLTENMQWAEDEPRIRKMAYKRALKDNPDADWIMCLDDDEVLPETEEARIFLESCSNDVDLVTGYMYHLWQDGDYRCDGSWAPENNVYTIFENLNSSRSGSFADRGIHTGRLPRHGDDLRLEGEIPIVHFGWRTSHEERGAKIRRRNRSMNLDVQVERNILKSLFLQPELKELPEKWLYMV